MISTKLKRVGRYGNKVWEICKFWFLQNPSNSCWTRGKFERYVNFDFYKTDTPLSERSKMFERYVNFDFYKTTLSKIYLTFLFERYVNFDFYKTSNIEIASVKVFERYVNFDFYKTYALLLTLRYGLRDM